MANMAEYLIRNIKTRHIVYVCESIRFGRKTGNEIHLYVSMCGYGPEGRSSYRKQLRTLEDIKKELSLFWKWPARKKELKNLIIERFSPGTTQLAAQPMEKIIREIEEDVIMKRLSDR